MIDNLETMNERKSQNYLGTIPERRTFVSNPIESIRKNQNPFPKCWKERDGDRLSISKLELEQKVSHTLRTVAEAARDRRNDRVYRYEL